MSIRVLTVAFFVFTGCALAQSNAQSDEVSDTYQGPSVLSRGGGSAAGERAGRLVDFQFWGDLSGVFDSGLTGVIVGPNGALESTANDFGLSAGGGVVGTKKWRHDQLTVDYTGEFHHYLKNSYYDGSDQLLQLKWQHEFSRHLSMIARDIGGISSLSYGDLSYVPLRNVDVVGLPANNLFDNTTYFNEGGVEMLWQKTARLSLGAGVSDFIIDHRSAALASMKGLDARGDAVYRLSRQQKVYLTYQYIVFDFQKAFGNSKMNMLAAGYSLDIGRRWSLEMQGGAYRVYTLGLVQQPVDPAIAIIIGSSYTTTTASRTVLIPDAEARITRRFSHSALDLGGASTVSPGNGVYLTSRAQTAFANYSVVSSRRLTFASTITYSSLSSAGEQTIGKFDSYNGGFGATYKISGLLSGECRYDYYHYTTQSTLFRKNENRVTLGIAFSSRDRPLAIW